MKKVTLSITVILIIITALAVGMPFRTDAYPSGDWSMWTKAICSEENYCIDVQITCEGDKVVDIKPVTDRIYFPKQWKDPRPDVLRNKLC